MLMSTQVLTVVVLIWYLLPTLGVSIVSAQRIILTIVIGTPGVVIMAGMLLSDIGRPAAVVEQTMLRQRLCPVCATDLAERATAHDGCVVCPECGAAWRIADSR
jgi:hypothetical protein